MTKITPKVDLELLRVGSHVDVATSKGLSTAKIMKLKKGYLWVLVIVHFEGSKEQFSKWNHVASILHIYSDSNPGAKGVIPT
jgi:hypothetical protein